MATQHTFTVAPFKASGPGALSGHAATCTCGHVYSTSLSARAARQGGQKHNTWHDENNDGRTFYVVCDDFTAGPFSRATAEQRMTDTVALGACQLPHHIESE